MLRYLKQLAQDVGHRGEALIVGPLWGAIHEYYLSGLFWTSPYLWVTMFWVGNWVLGTLFAIVDHKWTLRDSVRSILKLTIWCLALIVATGLRHVSFAGWVPAGVIEMGVVFTEGAYLLRNLGRCATRLGLLSQGRLLEMTADRTDEFLDSRVHTQTTVVVKETIITEPKELKP